jgi:hypothetical protein
LTRSALTVALLVAALVLAGCSVAIPATPAAISVAPATDATCVGGMGFVKAYSQVAAGYDPKLESDRQQLAATNSLVAARAQLTDIAGVLEAYDAALRPLHPTADLADGFSGLLGADQRLHDGALVLASSPFGAADQDAFQKVAGDRQAALHDLRLEVAFVTSECT